MRLLLATTLLLPSLALVALAVPDQIVRPNYENASGPLEGGAVLFYQGNINPGTTGPSSNGKFLSESTFGHPGAITQFSSPNSTYANHLLFARGGVYDALYPPGYRDGGVAASRAQLADRTIGGAFRYKWLIYGQDPTDTSDTPAILNLFEQTFQNTDDDTNPWFNDEDRDAARDQIEVLREALAVAPLSSDLQFALLDIHYDLATAEMQFARKRLAKLATIRLGIDSPATPFIINEEIEIYQSLIGVVGQALAWYTELLSLQMEGVEPGDFEPRLQGAPYGYFLFASRVPYRSQVETDLGYASGPGLVVADGGVATVVIPGDDNDFTVTGNGTVPGDFLVVFSEGAGAPTWDLPTKTLTIPITTGVTTANAVSASVGGAGIPEFVVASSEGNGLGLVSSAGPAEQIVDPGTSPVFAGYKDYRTLLTILGQYIQYKTDLARLLSMRSAAGDLTEAREALAEVQGPASSTFGLLQGMFPDVDFDDPGLDDTGVRAAYTLVDTALNESINVRSFVNGTSNVLGLDPNFLLLVPTKPGEDKFDTYDILAEKLNEVNGGTAVGPLAVALDELGDPDNPTTGGGAIQAYSLFRGSVDTVANELDQLEDDFAERFVEITGYPWNNGENAWDGINPHPSISSELATTQRTIDSLHTQSVNLGQLTLQLLADIKLANEAVSIADGIDDSILGAQAAYLDETSSAWTEIHIWAGAAAGTQAAAETAFGSVGVDAKLDLPGIAIAASAGAANTTVQTTAAVRTSMREQELENAALGWETAFVLAELPLTVQQAKLEVGALMREAYANRLEIEDNFTTLAQTIADQLGLRAEVERHQDNLNANRSELASRYYADPIHYLRAESALISADAAFRRAQRWLFFTVRALEYKWQERFSYANPQSGVSYDIGTIFKVRNALELEDLLQNMAFFNQDRELSPGALRNDRVTISLRDHVLTPNPDDVNREFGAFPPDEGLRVEPSTGEVVSTNERFRNILRDLQTAPSPGGGINGPIRISFDTSKLEIGQFFAGPDYRDPMNIDSGLYRDKIEWLAVHFVFEPGSSVNGNSVPNIPGNNGIDGSMAYSGNTFFRTRVPPCPDRSPGNTSPGEGEIPDSENSGEVQMRADFPGEFVVSPFRFYQDTTFSGIFDLFDKQNAPSLEFLFSTQSAEVPAVRDLIGSDTLGFQIPDFKERSVAATRWVLDIDSNQFNIDDLIDVEIVIQHRAYTRPQITCPQP